MRGGSFVDSSSSWERDEGDGAGLRGRPCIYEAGEALYNPFCVLREGPYGESVMLWQCGREQLFVPLCHWGQLDDYTDSRQNVLGHPHGNWCWAYWYQGHVANALCTILE